MKTSKDIVSEVILGRPLEWWYRDPVGCLHTCLYSVLRYQGLDPLETLGLSWEFTYLPSDVRREEFYYPCRYPGDPARSMAPYHPVSSSWQNPGPGEEPLRWLADRLRADLPVIVAVDNFYLPFRPAYHDVHAAHLIVVYGVDFERDTVLVLDTPPPGFDGPMASRDFLLAWGSANPADTRDAFFSDSAMGRRCLITRVTGPGGDPVGRAGVAAALRANLDGLTAPLAASQLPWTGLAGLHRYLDDLRQRAAAGDREVLADAYAFGWPMQAEAYLHAELLRAASVRWQLPALAGAARRVAAVSHAWTGVRVTAAHGRSDPLVAAGLGRHCERLSRRYDEAVEALAEAAAEVAGR